MPATELSFYFMSQTWDKFYIGTQHDLRSLSCSHWPAGADGERGGEALEEAAGLIRDSLSRHHPEAMLEDYWVVSVPSGPSFGGDRWEYAKMLDSAEPCRPNHISGWYILPVSEVDAAAAFYRRQGTLPAVRTPGGAQRLLLLTMDPDSVRAEQLWRDAGEPLRWRVPLSTDALDAALVWENLLLEGDPDPSAPASREEALRQYLADRDFRRRLRLRMRCLRHNSLRGGADLCAEEQDSCGRAFYQPADGALRLRLDVDMLTRALERPLGELLEKEPDRAALLSGASSPEDSWLCAFMSLLQKIKEETGGVRTVLCAGADAAMPQLLRAIDRCLELPNICCCGAEDAVARGTQLLMEPAARSRFQTDWIRYAEEQDLPEVCLHKALSPFYNVVLSPTYYLNKARQSYLFKRAPEEALARALELLRSSYQKAVGTELLSGLESRLLEASGELNRQYQELRQKRDIWRRRPMAGQEDGGSCLLLPDGIPSDTCEQLREILRRHVDTLRAPQFLSVLCQNLTECCQNGIDSRFWQDRAMLRLYEGTQLGHLEAEILLLFRQMLFKRSYEQVGDLFGPYSRHAWGLLPPPEDREAFHAHYLERKIKRLQERLEPLQEVPGAPEIQTEAES